MPVLVLAAACAALAGGVATNQVLDDGKLSWHWAYLAFGFVVLTSVFSLHAASPAPTGADRARWGRRWVYRRQLRASVTDMETIGVVTQAEFVLRMEQVYVDVALRPRPAQEAERDTGVGPEPAEPVDRPVGQREPLTAFVRRGRVLAVIGTPGSGKTTLVRHVALELCRAPWRAWPGRRRLPVLLYLRDSAAAILEGKALAEVAVSVPWLRGRIATSWMSRRLERGNCLVLLDGLDEVADSAARQRVVAWVKDQIDRYPRNAFVVTSRPHGYAANRLPNADVLQVQRFTFEQISRFLHSWYRAVEQRAREGTAHHVQQIADQQADDLLARLRGPSALYDLAANPLLLTMIANVHRYRGQLPGSRAALYAEMCDVLLHRRQEVKHLSDPTRLSGPQKTVVMQHLATHMMTHQVREVPAADAHRAIQDPLEQVGGDDLSPARFLDEARKSGLLVEREHGRYGFAHLTLQEYLAAAHIRQHPELLHLLTGNVDTPWWRETTLLWAADADATPLVDACLDTGTTGALTLAFDCADQARQLHPPTRARLELVLTTGDDADEEERSELAAQRRRLIAAVTASRALRDVTWIGDATVLSTRPVPADLWNMFVRHEQRQGRHTPAQISQPERTSAQASQPGRHASAQTGHQARRTAAQSQPGPHIPAQAGQPERTSAQAGQPERTSAQAGQPERTSAQASQPGHHTATQASQPGRHALAPANHHVRPPFLQAGQQGRGTPTQVSGDPQAAAVGMWAADTRRFLSWLNGLFDDGTTYRLPAPGEASQLDPALVPARHTLWTGDAHLQLHQPTGAPWPCSPDTAQLSRYPYAITDRVFPLIWLMRSTRADERRRLLTYARFVCFPVPGLGPMTELIRTVDLARTLNVARNLSLDAARALARTPERAQVLTQAHNLTVARAHDLADQLGISLAVPRDVSRGFPEGIPESSEGYRDRYRDVDHAIDIASHHTFQRARDLAWTRGLTLDLDRAVDRDHALNLALEITLWHAMKLLKDQDPEIIRRLPPPLDPQEVQRRDRDLSAAVRRDLELFHVLDRGVDTDLSFLYHPSIERAQAHFFAQTPNYGRDLALALVRDLAHQLGPHYGDHLPGFLKACEVFVPARANGTTGRQSGRGWVTPLDEQLVRVINRFTDAMSRSAEDPVQALCRAADLPTPTVAAPTVKELIAQARAVIEPVMDRRDPCEPGVFSTAGTALLAALTLLPQDSRSTELAEELARVLGTLIALTGPADGLAPNQILLLKREV